MNSDLLNKKYRAKYARSFKKVHTYCTITCSLRKPSIKTRFPLQAGAFRGRATEPPRRKLLRGLVCLAFPAGVATFHYNHSPFKNRKYIRKLALLK